MYILAAQRDLDRDGSGPRYREYLQQNAARFPPKAFALATSDWYFDPADHRCPHDAWLERFDLSEPSAGRRHEIRSVSLTVTLLGAYHDGIIQLRYPRVYQYKIEAGSIASGHTDW